MDTREPEPKELLTISHPVLNNIIRLNDRQTGRHLFEQQTDTVEHGYRIPITDRNIIQLPDTHLGLGHYGHSERIERIPDGIVQTNPDYPPFIRQIIALNKLDWPNLSLPNLKTGVVPQLSWVGISQQHLVGLKLYLGEHKTWREHLPTPEQQEQAKNLLAEIHRKGVYLNHFQPENLYVTQEGKVGFADFGEATIPPDRSWLFDDVDDLIQKIKELPHGSQTPVGVEVFHTQLLTKHQAGIAVAKQEIIDHAIPTQRALRRQILDTMEAELTHQPTFTQEGGREQLVTLWGQRVTKAAGAFGNLYEKWEKEDFAALAKW